MLTNPPVLLVGAFSVIVQLVVEPIDCFTALVVMNGDMPGPLFLLRATRNVVTSPRTVRDKYRDTLVIVIPNSHRAVSLIMKSGAGN